MKAKPVPWNDQNYAAFAASAAVKDEVALGDYNTVFLGNVINQSSISLPHDIIPPMVATAGQFQDSQVFIDQTGSILTIFFDEIIQDQLGFQLVNTDTSEVIPLTPLGNLGVVDSLRFQTSRTILTGENLLVTYTPGTVRDNANNFLLAMDIDSGPVVINNSTATTTTTT